MKKILSLVLALSLVLGTFSFAFAATNLPDDVVGEDSEEAVATLMALGVVNGYPDGTYKPEKTLTRAEMAKLLVEALGYGELSGGATVSFADTQGHWAQDYIGFAASIDLVLGYPDGTFRPQNTLTMDEAMTMVIRALGYTDDVLKGTWPTNYKVKALDLELTEDVSVLSGAASRGNVAIMLYNALDAKLVEVLKNADDVYRFEFIQGKDGEDKLLLDQIGTKVEEEFIDIDDVYGDDALDTVVDLEEYLFHVITYYENNDGDIAFVSDVDTEEVVGILTDVNEDDEEITVEDMDDDDTTFEIENNTPFFYNGDEATDTEILELPGDDTVEITVVHDDDDVVTGVIAWESEVARVASEYTTRRPLKINGANGFDLPENDDEELDEEALTVVGDADSLEDIMEDDVIHYYASDDTTKVRILVVRDTFTGRFTQRNAAGDEGVFGGEDFDVSKYSQIDLSGSDKLGDVYDLFLDKNGDIFAWEVSEEDVDKDYAVFVEGPVDGTIDTDRFGNVSVDDYPAVKLFTEGGDVVTYDFDTSDLDLEDEGDTVTLGDIELEIDGDEILVIEDEDFDFKSLVEIELDEDGYITSMNLIDILYDGYDEGDMLVDNYDLTDDTVIFNVSDDDEDDWSIVNPENLAGNIEGAYDVSRSTFNVLAMTVTEGLADSGTYAAVTDVVEYYDGSDTVQKITAFVNGEEGVYYTTEDDTTSTNIEGKIVTFSFDGDDVNAVNTPPNKVTIKVDSIDSLRVSDDDDVWAFANDSAIYILDEDGDFLVGDAADVLENDMVTLYLVEDDDDGRINDVKVLLLDLEDEDEEPTTPVDGAEVTYINEDEELIEVDDQVLELDRRVRLRDEDGRTIAIGPKDVAAELMVGDRVELTEEDGIVTEIRLVEYDGLDRDDLNDAKDAAADLDEDDYTAASWADLEDALDMDEDTQQEIDDKADAIWDAIDDLVEVGEGEITAEATLEGELLGVQSYSITLDGADNEDVDEVLVNGDSKTFEIVDGKLRVNSGEEVVTIEVVIDGETIEATIID